MQIGIYNQIVKIEEPIKITTEYIYSNVDQVSMFEYYLGYSVNTTKHYKSPFSNDSTPSFRLKVNIDYKLTYKCFSTGKQGDIFNLVSELYNLSFIESINKIAYDFKLVKNKQNKKINLCNNLKNSNININFDPTKIEVILFDKEPISFINYWKQFYIEKDLLDFYNVKSVKEVWINNNLYSEYTDKNIVIRYLVNNKYKIYKPFEKKQYKWRTTFDSKCIFGFKQLDYSLDTIIISKSSKDVLVWRLLGYNAITLPTEASRLWKELVEWLYDKFKYVISILDNDIAGIRSMESYKTDWGVHYVILPDLGVENQCKDLAEIIFSVGYSYTQSLINVLIKNKKDEINK